MVEKIIHAIGLFEPTLTVEVESTECILLRQYDFGFDADRGANDEIAIVDDDQALAIMRALIDWVANRKTASKL